jgi:Spo0E like sporulation regulatory protein.
MDKQLLGQVEWLRNQMNTAFEASNDTQHREVQELSRSLDELILLVQRKKRPPRNTEMLTIRGE